MFVLCATTRALLPGGYGRIIHEDGAKLKMPMLLLLVVLVLVLLVLVLLVMVMRYLWENGEERVVKRRETMMSV